MLPAKMEAMDSCNASSPVELTPLRFHPWLRPTVWGGKRLSRVLGKPVPGKEPCGESWEVSDHPLHRSIVAAGPWAGRSLRQLMEERREALLGPAASAHETFPWLIKFLDADDRLSVQVHPNEATVRDLRPGEGPKTEAWLVLDAAPSSRIWAGLLPGVDEKALRAALGQGRVADCLYSFEPRPGDCVFLPAGTVHAVGGGVLLAEVQQTSDATFRLFDWDRRDPQGTLRTLHVEEALASIHWDQGPVTPIHVSGMASESAQERRQTLVRCPFFVVDYVEATKPLACGGLGCLQAVIVVRGRGRLGTDEPQEPLGPGQTRVFPASMAAAKLVPDPYLGFLICTLQ
jgi:mannose-6-phosphate isomerase